MKYTDLLLCSCSLFQLGLCDFECSAMKKLRELVVLELVEIILIYFKIYIFKKSINNLYLNLLYKLIIGSTN